MAKKKPVTLIEPAPVVTGYPIAPGPSAQEATDAAEAQAGRGAEGIRPDASDVWTTSSQLESLNSAFGFRSGFGGQFFRWLDEGLEDKRASELGIEEKLSPDEANKRYPFMQKPFTESVYPSVAAMRAESTQQQMEMRAWMDRGPQMTGWDQFTSMATSGLDPLNLAMGMGVSKLFRAESFLAKVGDNIAGNIAADIPTYALRKQGQQDVNIGETLAGSVAGGVVGTIGFEALGRALGFSLKAANAVGGPAFERMSRATRERLVRASVLQHESGSKIDMSPAARVASANASGEVRTGATAYAQEFSPMADHSDRALYGATLADTGAPAKLGADYGDGIYLSDKQSVANNAAANVDGVNTGEVRSVVVSPDAKILNLEVETPATRVFTEAVARELGIEIDGAQSPKEFIAMIRDHVEQEALPANTMNKIGEVAKAQGVDGYRFVEGDAPETQRNGLYLFDDSKLQETERFAPDQDAAPKMTPEQMAAESDNVLAPERGEFYHPEIAKEIEDSLATKETPESIDSLATEQEAAARKILTHEDAPPEIAEKIAAIDEEHKTAMRTQGWVKVLAECVVRGFT